MCVIEFNLLCSIFYVEKTLPNKLINNRNFSITRQVKNHAYCICLQVYFILFYFIYLNPFYAPLLTVSLFFLLMPTSVGGCFSQTYFSKEFIPNFLKYKFSQNHTFNRYLSPIHFYSKIQNIFLFQLKTY